MWVLGLSCVLGNIFVLYWRIRSKTQNDIQTVQAIFVGNLAFSDLLMGLYMTFLASVDRYYGDEFFKVADDWRVSGPCRVASVLTVLSSETSLLLILFITIDRYLVLVFPFSVKHFKKLSASVVVIGIWCITLPISLSASIFADVDSDFYELSDVCIGLPLVTRPGSYDLKINTSQNTSTAITPLFEFNVPSGYKSSWYFSFVIYLGLNFCVSSVIVVLYIIVFLYVRKARKAAQKTRKVEDDIIMALRMTGVAMVNGLCWLPVTIVSILSQTNLISAPLELYIWTVVFILPLNAALNPYVYTLSLLLHK